MALWSTTQFWDASVNLMDSKFASNVSSFYAQELCSKIGLHQGKVLDIATGTGSIPFLLEKSNTELQITGVDFSEKMIERSIAKRQENSQINFQVMDGQDLKFEEETFDFVFTHFGLMFYQDVEKGITEVKRVLKKGGRAGLSVWTEWVPGKECIEALIRLGLMPNVETPATSLKNPEELKQKFLDAGFESVQVVQSEYVTKLADSEYPTCLNHLFSRFPDKTEEIMEEVKKIVPVDEDNKLVLTLKANLVYLTK